MFKNTHRPPHYQQGFAILATIYLAIHTAADDVFKSYY